MVLSTSLTYRIVEHRLKFSKVSATVMQKRALITGASRGIGVELTKQLAAAGWCVYATCRARTTELDSIDLNGGHVIENVDVTTSDGTSAILKGISERKIDLLINNAGMLGVETLDDLNVNSIRLQFEVNSLAPLLLTSALLKSGNISDGSKVTMISSVAGSMASQATGGVYGYRMSKAALNMASVLLANDLKPRGIPLLIIHPGAVDTAMLNKLTTSIGYSFPGVLTTAQSATEILKRIELTDMASSGKFFHVNGEEVPW